ncbi:30 kDa heat shock protein [Chaetomidium leptoderma]|uniref:30 kDa heat shock protein n=1 Tax=Chaetomidium leptoderma TaxID=669021 RepID=A0AAN6VDW9_9PEZI|nr:30 kDa heat shock protein [Chaetomidium leptoderma]
MMSFFPRSFYAPAPAPADTSFVPLFRLLEDYDNYSRQVQQGAPADPSCRRQRARQPRSQPSTFHPKFDVRETEHTYELHGELPGLERENVNIEFTEPQTVVIRGWVERGYGSESDNGNSNNVISDDSASTEKSAIETEKQTRRNSHQATVEDDPEDTPASTPAASPKMEDAVLASMLDPQLVAQMQMQTQAENKPKYRRWERSVGEFSRTFTFSARVDQDAVTASLSNGILSITVPKAQKPVARRIEITV